LSINEGDTGTHSVAAQVSLSAPSSSSVTVQFATESTWLDGYATAGIDFTSTSGTLSFSPGETTKTISVPIIGDTVYEGDEIFLLKLTGATGAVVNLDRDIKLVTISNDDVPSLPGNFNALDYLASYGDLAAAFGTDEHAAALHYIEHGRAEGRATKLFASTESLIQVEGVAPHYQSDFWIS